ncbi:hypothetical protein [Streptomyces natalensis]|uniref:hypothetical protein n=1 Tax=Streptomyces natalensis TaxID=68242 RepID=UPI000A7646D6|nr:hypothetical protein [Streptomyces natalensis]
MKLAETEINRYDWARLRCGCGQPATHVAVDLLQIAGVVGEDRPDTGICDGHVFASAVLFEPALAAVSVALAALADDISLAARRAFSELLLLLVASEGQPTQLVLEGRDLIGECITSARNGIWLLYSEVLSGRCVDAASNAYETLSIIDENDDRISRVQAAAGDLLRSDLQ